MELIFYDLHLNTKKIKVNKFLFALNVTIHEKVRIMMPQNLHNFVQKTLIEEEELISEGQSRTPTRPVGQATSSV
jgi:hypothetical protein